jgi:hypothetical protein
MRDEEGLCIFMLKGKLSIAVSEMVTNYLDGDLTFESEVGAWATERLFSVDGRSDVNEKVRTVCTLRQRRRWLNHHAQISAASHKKWTLSLRSRRKHEAWGVSPRVKAHPIFKPANAGDRAIAVNA